MIGTVVMAAYMALVCVATFAATGGSRGWFPGGEEEPEPAPQPEQHVPSWARP